MSINTGATSPGTMADNATVGTVTWTNPDNAKVSDGVFATAYLNYSAVDAYVQIIKSNGTIGTTNKANTVDAWTSVNGTYYPYGSSSDLWGETWSASDINNSNFGVAFSASGTIGISHYLKATNFGFSIPTGATINGILVEVEKFNTSGNRRVDHIRITVYYTLVAPTVTTEAVSLIKSDLAIGNGTVTSDGGATVTERGVCIGASANPTTAGTKFTTGGTTGAYTVSMTGLTRNTTYHARAYAINSVGTSYGSDVTFTTIGFTNPANIYSTNNVYATLAATSGILTVEVSKDAGANWQTPKTVTFTGSDSLQVVGNGDTELFGSSFTRADLVDANFRIRLSQGNISQVYKNFGFSTGTDILTGINISIEGNYNSPTLSLDLLECKIFYGSSVLPVQMGSVAFASDGRKVGETAGNGTGTPVYYDSISWRRTGDDTTVLA